MPDLLLELFSEEIPARMQAQAAEDLQRLVLQGLSEQGLGHEGAAHFATPRRLALHVAGVPVRQADVREEKKGPRVGAPEAAVQGFLKSAGLNSLDQARIEKDAKKGDFYLAVIEKPGRDTVEVLAEMLPAIITHFPWPKSMRWGAQSGGPEALRWVRPLHSILATFGPETEEPETVHFEVGGLRSGRSTFGHRFMAPAEITIRRFDDYGTKLERAKVVLDAARRRDIILHDAKDLCLARGLELVEDEALLQEVAGLVEWPVVLVGHFDERFLELPPQVIRTTIRINQKCFVLRDPAKGGLANQFILVANIQASDAGAAIAAGNGRVVQARLSDAQFFWETDLKIKLEERLPKLDTIIFHEKLGTQSERVKRLVLLSQDIAALTGANPAEAERAALLCKADLVSEMVGEFPELQGLMGRLYAKAQGEPEPVAEAIEDHYKPQGPSDRVPSAPVAVALALADKIDLLVGFWAADERPTGSKDPFALRRAALGIIALILENKLRIPLRQVLEASFAHHVRVSEFVPAHTLQTIKENDDFDAAELTRLVKGGLWAWEFQLEPLQSASLALHRYIEARFTGESELDEADAQHFETLHARLKPYEALREIWLASASSKTAEGRAEFAGFRRAFLAERGGLFESLLGFFADRLKVFLRERGARFDLIDAVFALGGQDDLWLIVERVKALNVFIESEEGQNLLAGYRRAVNILKAEEKKASAGEALAFGQDFEPELLRDEEENALAQAIDVSASDAALKVKAEDFTGAMRALAGLRAPVDAFFEKVTVNAPEPELRLNRLRLLSELRRAMHGVADFSLIAG